MNSCEKLARILGTPTEALLDLDQKMSVISVLPAQAGKADVLNIVAGNNDQNVDRVLTDLGLTRTSTAEEVYDALTGKLLDIDKKLFELLDKPDLSKLSENPGKIRDVALSVFTPPQGFFIKKEKISELLTKQSPGSLLEHFGYRNVGELLEKEGFASVVAALRFTQTSEWMHQFFSVAYVGLKPEDFEDREVEIKVLDIKWLAIAQKFIGKKLHNVSHLKEYGVIFISPEPINVPGETLRTFLLLLHYLHEVPFYSGLFRKFLNDSGFVSKLQSLLRGDVLDAENSKLKTQNADNWIIIQRYLAKDDIHDPRLSMCHVNPEAEHWYRVAQNFQKLAEAVGDTTDKFSINYWTNLDHVGDFFKNKEGVDTFVSFNVVDLVMSLVTRSETKYIYHQSEAMWNYIFSEYMGRDQMNRLVEENIIKGFISI